MAQSEAFSAELKAPHSPIRRIPPLFPPAVYSLLRSPQYMYILTSFFSLLSHDILSLNSATGLPVVVPVSSQDKGGGRR